MCQLQTYHTSTLNPNTHLIRHAMPLWCPLYTLPSINRTLYLVSTLLCPHRILYQLQTYPKSTIQHGQIPLTVMVSRKGYCKYNRTLFRPCNMSVTAWGLTQHANCSRAQNTIRVWNPMSILNTALLSITLTVAPILTIHFIDSYNYIYICVHIYIN